MQMETHQKIHPKLVLSHNINSPILVKHSQSNTELQALKNCNLKIEAQMFGLKSHVKVSFIR